MHTSLPAHSSEAIESSPIYVVTQSVESVRNLYKNDKLSVADAARSMEINQYFDGDGC